MKIKIAENIKRLRKAHSFTQEQMAEALGVTVGAVYKWEAGLSVPEIKLLMEIADFFEISVDALLGYEQQKGNVDSRTQRIKQCVVEKDYEEGVLEVEKALKKYPNNFNITYVGALMYMMKFVDEKDEVAMMKSNQLFEKSISLLYQNKETSINEATILNQMANNYLTAGKIEEGLKLLEQNNIGGINSSKIGFFYATELSKPKEAERYLFSSLAKNINEMTYTLAGMAYSHAALGDKKCLSDAAWLMQFWDSLKEDENKLNFFDKLKSVLLAQCAVWELTFHNETEAERCICDAYVLAKRFDETPIYAVQNIRLLKDIEREGTLHDGIGKKAVEAVENFVFGKGEETKQIKRIKKRWEELKHGETDS